MSDEQCGAPTQAGESCRWPFVECPVTTHRVWRLERGLPVPAEAPSARGQRRARLARNDRAALRALVERRDVRSLGWWLVEHTIGREEMSPREIAVLGTLLRTLGGLGPDDLDEEQALADAVLRGVVMHGVPPRSDEEWERARALFDDEALVEFRRWRALREVDADDVDEPLRRADGGADHPDVAVRLEDEDRG
jgi:hypothetical protein